MRPGGFSSSAICKSFELGTWNFELSWPSSLDFARDDLSEVEWSAAGLTALFIFLTFLIFL